MLEQKKPESQSVVDNSSRRTVLRGAWIVLATIALAIMLLAIPGILVRTPLGNLGSHLVFESTPLALTLLHLSSVLLGFSAVLSLALAALLFAKKWDEPMGIFLSFFLLAHGILFAGPIEMLEPIWPNAAWVNSFVLLPLLYMPASVALVGLFPDGRFVPRWSRWLVISFLLFIPFVFLMEPGDLPLGFGSLPITIYAVVGLLTIGVFGALAYAQIYRYRTVSSELQRQQTKWVLFGIIMWLLIQGVSGGPWMVALSLPAGTVIPIWIQAASPLFALSAAFLPVTLTIAIMRYRLYEIDILINRTIVYAILSLSLALFYFFSVALLQTVLPGESPVAIVISTLAIAALFAPLRRRIQKSIDGRFYRRRIDAELTLSTFGATVRDQVDVEALSEALLATVEKSIQPKHISLWLRHPDQSI